MSMEPQFRFCTSVDGTRIAYAIYGSGPPLLYAKGTHQSMDARFTLPEARAYFDALAQCVTLVTFDKRGTGASTRDVDDLSPEAQAGDIAAVADAAGLRSFTLFAEDRAMAACAHYIIANEKQVERLVCWGAIGGNYAEGARAFREDWSRARRALAGQVYPQGPVSLQRAFGKNMKDTLSGEMAARHLETLAEVDFDALLAAVAVPALVLQRERLIWPNARQNTIRVAGLLPHSQLRFIAGNYSTPYPEHEPVVEAVLDFMGLSAPVDEASEAAATPRDQTSLFRTILFTDLVGHTEMMQRLGDERGRDVLREHERITRETLAAHGGSEVKTMGDGFMASFGSVTKAVECAIALQSAFAGWNREEARGGLDPRPLTLDPSEALHVRVGLNAGEPIAEEGDLFGATVILASRIAAQAGAGEILVPDTVRGLCSGKGFLFADRGEFVPKGFDEAVRLYEVRWQD